MRKISLGPMGYLLLIFLLLSCRAHAGEIRGQVLSTEGKPVPGAEISVKKLDGKYRQVVSTQPDGRYEVRELGEGPYTLTVSEPGGMPSLRRVVVVGTPDSRVRMDFRLPLIQAADDNAAEEASLPKLPYLPDLNSLRRQLMIEHGPDPQPIHEFLPEQNTFGAELGSPLREFQPLRSRAAPSQWRSSISDGFQNNALNARSFFTVGDLPAARTNQYDVSAGGPLPDERAAVFAHFGRLWDSGALNGNVQAPKAGERIPLANDPRARAVIAALLRAYGSGLPNFPAGPAISERQRNSNAPYRIDGVQGLFRFDARRSAKSALAFLYSVDDYKDRPAEFVIGQKPQTDSRRTALQMSLTHNFSARAVVTGGFHFDRLAISLSPTEAFGKLFGSQEIANQVPDVDFQADSLEDIGPGAPYPRRQVQNRFQLYSDATHLHGKHNLKLGWGSARIQLNDLQSDHVRGTLIFAADFGRSEIENFLLGRPALWLAGSGDYYRGFRNWEHFFYFGDRIRLKPSVDLSLGLRYEAATAPAEVRGRTEAGYSTDLTNFSPRLGLAWHPAGSDLTIRGGYGISYGVVFPATYQFARFSPPEICVEELAAPELASLFFSPPIQRSAQQRCALRRVSADLVTPYSHQYTLSGERELPGSFFVRLSYFGTRSFHLFTQEISNRGRPVPGIPLATETLNDRRPDRRYYSVAEIESNSIAYYDAAQLSLQKRLTRGLTFRATYTFSKNIDLGGDFTNTASGVEIPPQMGVSSSEMVSRVGDLKGWSLLDTPHHLMLSYTYLVPSAGPLYGWKAWLRGWEISGTTVLQSGLPFSVHSADGPGLGNVDGVFNDRPNLLDPSILGQSITDPETSATQLRKEFFDTHIPPGGRGNIGYNVFRKDGMSNWNLSVGKVLRFRGAREISVRFRAEFHNLFNHPQFEKPESNLLTPGFGKITDTTNQGRTTRLSVRVDF
ncbi:MAG: TonB-dependent receptor [Acidobacteria bacterium]|nr:TonB-dependent receptor [Acidobacteriota bacterium]